MGLQLLFSHKRQFSYSLGFGNHSDGAFLYLAKQAIKGVELDVDSISSFDEKKNLFYLQDMDDAITAQLYKAPVELKGFSIQIYHHRHLYSGPLTEIGDSEIRIYSSGESKGAVAVFGRRAQTLHSFFSSGLSWPESVSFELWGVRKEQEAWVKKVEGESWAGSQALLTPQTPRLYDRAILYWKSLDAGALRETLITQFSWSPKQVEGLSLTRWMDTKVLQQFEKRGFSAECYRGCLFLAADLESHKSAKKELEQAVAKVKSLSQF